MNTLNCHDKEVIVLVDGSSFLFRAYHALPALSNSSGQPTGAILGVINMLKKLISNYNPKFMAVVFDSKQPTFRHELFSAYKAHRAKMPEELASQLPFLFEIICALGINLIQIPGVEADDIIGSVAIKAKKQQLFSIIVTGDKDLAQLVDEDMVIFNTTSELIWDVQGVIDKFQVPPSKIVDYLILIGDSADNIPGVAKVGPKTAVQWLNTYDNLAGIVANIDKITGKVRENLITAIPNFPLYTKLVTINKDLDYQFNLPDFTIKPRQINKLKVLFEQLEMHSWSKEISQAALPIAPDNLGYKDPSSRILVTTVDLEQSLEAEDLLSSWVAKLFSSEIFAIHVTTHYLDIFTAEITGIYLATISDQICFRSKKFKELLSNAADEYRLKLPPQYNMLQQSIISLCNLLTDRHKLKVTYNLKYLAHILANHGIQITTGFFDVMLAKYVINSVDIVKFDPNVMNAANILELYYSILPNLEHADKLNFILQQIEIPLAIVLKNMERVGVLVDIDKLSSQSKIIDAKLIELEQTVYALAKQTFNLNSPKQLAEVLYNQLKLPILATTPKGHPSTAEEVLQELALEFDLPKILLSYRTLSKLKSTYVDKIPKTININTGRIHTSYHQTVTATGRLSSSDPNLQNIPIKTLEGRKIREAFIARAGYNILSADYSQIELRILAHLSEDPGLINAFMHEQDIHAITASEVFQLELAQVTDDLRRKAKAINFGLIYGMSDFGLARQLKISKVEAAAYIQSYFAKFPKVLKFMETTRECAAKCGFVETMFGRRLYLPDINSNNRIKRQAAERAAINAPMQGGQADLIKLAMLRIDNWLQTDFQDVFMLLQVHDELVFEIPNYIERSLLTPSNNSREDANNKLAIISNKIRELMGGVASLKVPLKVDIGIGDSWGAAH